MKKKHPMRRILAVLLSVLLLSSALPGGGLLAEGLASEEETLAEESGEAAEEPAEIFTEESGEAAEESTEMPAEESTEPVMEAGDLPEEGTEEASESEALLTEEVSESVAEALETETEETEAAAEETPSEAAPEAVPAFTGLAGGSLVSEEQLSGMDFSSKRLLIAGATIIDPENMLSEYDGVYLMQYEDETTAKYAYSYYYGNAAFVDVDSVISIADGTGDTGALGSEEMSEEKNPLSELQDAVEKNSTAYSSPVIALIDTGVNSDPAVIEWVSMVGDRATDDNGHGSNMAIAIRSVNPDAKILSIKALGADGTGDASAVYAAIRYAIDRKVSIINLSMAAVKKAENAAIASIVEEAVQQGIKVVGAAGNYGNDAKFYIPGSIGSALIIGACDESGKRIEKSNYGATVDFNVVADSTSKAAAIYSGLLSKGEGEIDRKLVFPTEENAEKEQVVTGNGQFVVQDPQPASLTETLPGTTSDGSTGIGRYSVRLGENTSPYWGMIATQIFQTYLPATPFDNIRFHNTLTNADEILNGVYPAYNSNVNPNWSSATSINGESQAGDTHVAMQYIWKKEGNPVYCFDYAADDAGNRTYQVFADLPNSFVNKDRLQSAYNMAKNLSANDFQLVKDNLTGFFRNVSYIDSRAGFPVEISAENFATQFKQVAISDTYQTIVQYLVWYYMHNAELQPRLEYQHTPQHQEQVKEQTITVPEQFTWTAISSELLNPDGLIGVGLQDPETYTIPEISAGATSGDITAPGTKDGQILVPIPVTGLAKVHKESTKTEWTDDNPSYSMAGIKYAFYRDDACTTLAKKVDGTDAIVTLDANGDSETIELSVSNAGSTRYWVKEYDNPAASNYITSSDVKAEDLTATGVKVWQVTEEPYPGEVGVVKKYTDGNTVFLTSAVYGLYATEANANADTSRLGMVTIAQSDITNGTSALKKFGAELGIGKTYYVKEISVAPSSIAIDKNVYSVTAARNITASSAASVAVSTDKLNNGFMRVKKVSANPEITNGNSCYDLSGIQFKVYTSAACTTEAKNAAGSAITLQTDANGLTQTVEMIIGDYWVKEVPASLTGKGWKVNGTPKKVTVSPTNTSGNPVEVEISNTANSDPIGILLKKADDGRGTEGGRVAF